MIACQATHVFSLGVMQLSDVHALSFTILCSIIFSLSESRTAVAVSRCGMYRGQPVEYHCPSM